MAEKVEVTSYDAGSKRYTAQLTVTSETGDVSQYSIEGTWHSDDGPMAAGALYDQYRARQALESTAKAEREAIASAITSEVAKLSAIAKEALNG